MKKIYLIILLVITIFTMSSCLNEKSCVEHDYKVFDLKNINGEFNEIIFKCHNCKQLLNKTLKFNAYKTSDVSLLSTIDKNTLDKNNYSVVGKKDIFNLNKLNTNNYYWTEDLNLSGGGHETNEGSRTQWVENKTFLQVLNLDDFSLNYYSYLTDDFKNDLLKLEENIITAEYFCSVYGNAVVGSTVKYRYNKFYVELSENNEDISVENKLLEYIFYPSKFNDEESKNIEKNLSDYNYNFEYFGTENIQDVQQMIELFRNIETISIEDSTFFNFVNDSICITEFIPDEYSNAKKLVYDYIWR